MHIQRRLDNVASLILAVLLAVFATAATAADHIVDFDHLADFSTVRTFSFRGMSILMDRPEVRSQLVQDQLSATLRTALTSRGLKETTENADVIVDWTVSGQRFAVNEWSRAVPLDQVPGERRMPPGNPWRDLPEAFVEGVLVVDLTARSSGLLIWRGVYRNRESGSAKFAHQLPNYATKLLAGYPPREKMNRKLHCLLLVMTLSTVLAPTIGRTGEGNDVSFDASVDFRAIKTFAMGQGQLSSSKPEIANRLFRQRMESSIRAALLKKGLTEVAEHPDVSVSYSFYDKDVSAVERQGPVRITEANGRDRIIQGSGANPVLYTEGTLVIDLTNASNSLLWRGTWRDQENSGPSLSRKLSEDAVKLLSRYPPKRR